MGEEELNGRGGGGVKGYGKEYVRERQDDKKYIFMRGHPMTTITTL